jgi:hypothetical protein
MFSKYVTHKSRLQIAGFHNPCGVVNLYKDAKPFLETICDNLATLSLDASCLRMPNGKRSKLYTKLRWEV